VASPDRLVLTIDAMSSIVTMTDIVTASLQAQQEGLALIRLVGDARKIEESLRQIGASPADIEILHSEQDVGRRENGARAIKIKKRTSLQMAAVASLTTGEPLISFGNGSALREVIRQSLSIPGRLCPFAGRLTYGQHQVTVLDVGAFVHTSGAQLVQFGLMGSTMHTLTTSRTNASVGLLSGEPWVSQCPDRIREAHLGLHEKCSDYMGLVTAEQLIAEPPDVIVMDAQYGGFFYQRERQLQHSANQAQPRTPGIAWGTMFNRAAKTQAKTTALQFRSMLALGTRNVVVYRPNAATAQQVLDTISDAHHFHQLDVSDSIHTQLSVVGERDFRTTVENPIV
jgi:fatty acid/phospholipid biosynthesis enzyme